MLPWRRRRNGKESNQFIFSPVFFYNASGVKRFKSQSFLTNGELELYYCMLLMYYVYKSPVACMCTEFPDSVGKLPSSNTRHIMTCTYTRACMTMMASASSFLGLLILFRDCDISLMLEICLKFDIYDLDIERFDDVHFCFYFEELQCNFVRFVLVRNGIMCLHAW